MLLLLGQQCECDTHAFENVIPCPTSDLWTIGIFDSASHRWSSVSTKSTLGGRGSGWAAAVNGTGGASDPIPVPRTHTHDSAAASTRRTRTRRGARRAIGRV